MTIKSISMDHKKNKRLKSFEQKILVCEINNIGMVIRISLT